VFLIYSIFVHINVLCHIVSAFHTAQICPIFKYVHTYGPKTFTHIYIYCLHTMKRYYLYIILRTYIHTYIDMHIVYIVYISIGYLGTGARFSFLKPRSSQMLPAASKMLSGPGVDKMPWRSHHVDITWMC
jgi:hypothetical protein